MIKAQDKHLKDAVAAGDTAHEPALKDMKGRWKHPIKGMGWYKDTKRELRGAARGLTARTEENRQAWSTPPTATT